MMPTQNKVPWDDRMIEATLVNPLKSSQDMYRITSTKLQLAAPSVPYMKVMTRLTQSLAHHPTSQTNVTAQHPGLPHKIISQMPPRVWGDAENPTDSSHSCTILGEGSVSPPIFLRAHIFGAAGLVALIVDQFRW
ncbi:hypothetical protein FPOAC1_010616 [Fusarium poae]|uniref:hypothetical protein n=1 Tax=Fusarium poae TaxID=36050 RepID=UPI001CEAE052|nr:hypothetical protein FPOAC1_010616 [Fusarium poae]KAG8665815.1 hypothetical protein FPOAC1_010616 [Fusarium poae]